MLITNSVDRVPFSLLGSVIQPQTESREESVTFVNSWMERVWKHISFEVPFQVSRFRRVRGSSTASGDFGTRVIPILYPQAGGFRVENSERDTEHTLRAAVVHSFPFREIPIEEARFCRPSKPFTS